MFIIIKEELYVSLKKNSPFRWEILLQEMFKNQKFSRNPKWVRKLPKIYKKR